MTALGNADNVLAWDMAFLALGAAPVGIGALLVRYPRAPVTAAIDRDRAADQDAWPV